MGEDNSVVDVVGDALTSQIGKLVAFVLTPLLTTFFTAGAYWLQNVLGIDVQEHVAVAVAYVTTIGVGVAGAAMVWLRNRGVFEVAVATTAQLHQQGLALQGEQDVEQGTTLAPPPSDRPLTGKPRVPKTGVGDEERKPTVPPGMHS